MYICIYKHQLLRISLLTFVVFLKNNNSDTINGQEKNYLFFDETNDIVKKNNGSFCLRGMYGLRTDDKSHINRLVLNCRIGLAGG